MPGETRQHGALIQLGGATADAIANVLGAFLPDAVQYGEPTLIESNQDPFAGLPPGGVAASVRYVEGASGANVLIMPADGARALATAMGTSDTEGPLSDLEMSAIGEAANQMLASAASAISVVIGHEIEISPPDTRVIDAKLDPASAWGTAPFVCTTAFTIAGQICRFVQLVPTAVLMRMASAIEDLNMRETPRSAPGVRAEQDSGGEPSLPDQLGGVQVRVWAELGRTQLPIGAALELPPGAVVDLDRTVSAPVDLFANGLCFGRGNLLVTDDGEWAIQVISLNKPFVRRPALAGGAGIVAEQVPAVAPAVT